MPRPSATANVKLRTSICATPASSTKILNGAGGGSSDGISTAIMPWRWNAAFARSMFFVVKRFATSASPPFRPM